MIPEIKAAYDNLDLAGVERGYEYLIVRVDTHQTTDEVTAALVGAGFAYADEDTAFVLGGEWQ